MPALAPINNSYIEPFIRYLRDDNNIHGVSLPGPQGVGRITKRVYAFADDLKCWCRGPDDLTYLDTPHSGPFAILRRAANQRISAEKLTVIVMGMARSAHLPDMPVKQWVRYGIDEADKT